MPRPKSVVVGVAGGPSRPARGGGSGGMPGVDAADREIVRDGIALGAAAGVFELPFGAGRGRPGRRSGVASSVGRRPT